MNKQAWLMSLTVLALLGGAVGLLAEIRVHQKLGLPGVKTHPVANSIRLEAELPDRVLNYRSQLMDTDDVTIKTLPADTSFGYRRYLAPDGLLVDLRVVLMGADRTSLHKPQFCLTSQGWEIDETVETSVRVQKPQPYELPIIELIATRIENGNRTSQRALYVYWYVAADRLNGSASGMGRMWSMAEQLIRTGVLQRWAYISCFSPCAPGQEGATFARMKEFIAASVPDFQLYPVASGQSLTSRE